MTSEAEGHRLEHGLSLDNSDLKQPDDLVASANALVVRCMRSSAVQTVQTVQQLQQSASSMFVAVFEAIFRLRLRQIVRTQPLRQEDRVQNADVVISKLRTCPLIRDRLPADLSGERIVAGDLEAVALLVDVFLAIADIHLATAAEEQGNEPLQPPASTCASGVSLLECDFGDDGARASEADVADVEDNPCPSHAPLPSSGPVPLHEKWSKKPRTIKRRKKSSPGPRIPAKATAPIGVGKTRRAVAETDGAFSTSMEPQARSNVTLGDTSISSVAPGSDTGAAADSDHRSQTARTLRPMADIESRPETAPAARGGVLENEPSAANVVGERFPAMWRSFLVQHQNYHDQKGHLKGKDNQRRLEADDRAEQYRQEYDEVCADRERANRLRLRAAERQARYRTRALLHQEKVERIKTRRLEETLHAQRVSDKMRRETLSETRMKFFLQQILKRLHECRRAEDAAEVDQLKEMYAYGQHKAELVEHMYRERIRMAKDFISSRREENATVYKAQEALMAKMLKELEALRDEKIRRTLDRDQQQQHAALRRTDELYHALCEAMQVEDWDGYRRDRFLTPANTALATVIKKKKPLRTPKATQRRIGSSVTSSPPRGRHTRAAARRVQLYHSS